MAIDLSKKAWFEYAEHDVIELLKQSILLEEKVEHWDTQFHDYSFLVFPAAKAYEGFLKKVFLDIGIISEKEYLHKHFRIGSALNPVLGRRKRKRDNAYDKLEDYCGGEGLAKSLWQTWKSCRNIIFHWFPNERNAIDLAEAKQCVSQIIDSFDLLFKECKIDYAK